VVDLCINLTINVPGQGLLKAILCAGLLSCTGTDTTGWCNIFYFPRAIGQQFVSTPESFSIAVLLLVQHYEQAGMYTFMIAKGFVNIRNVSQHSWSKVKLNGQRSHLHTNKIKPYKMWREKKRKQKEQTQRECSFLFTGVHPVWLCIYVSRQEVASCEPRKSQHWCRQR